MRLPSTKLLEWTGSEITFDETAVVVKDDETTLTLTADYTVTAPTGTLQDTGDYIVTINGAGDYIGSREATFTITPKPVMVKNDLNEDVPAATGDAERQIQRTGLAILERAVYRHMVNLYRLRNIHRMWCRAFCRCCQRQCQAILVLCDFSIARSSRHVLVLVVLHRHRLTLDGEHRYHFSCILPRTGDGYGVVARILQRACRGGHGIVGSQCAVTV